MNKIRLIALDLDGTLLNSDKILTTENNRALRYAHDRGVHIVPATGRFYPGIPQCIRSLDYIRYAITINGAGVCDVAAGKTLYKAEIPYKKALEIMTVLDELPVIYDCYVDNWGRMTRSMYDKAEEYVFAKHTLDMVKNLRTPVDDLKEFLGELRHDVQKIQMFFKDMDERARAMSYLKDRFPDMVVTSSIYNNIEFNSIDATKGKALLALATHLGIDRSEIVAFGDDENDIPMLIAAGCGVAMGNASEKVKENSDAVTLSCDENGIAKALESFINEGRI